MKKFLAVLMCASLMSVGSCIPNALDFSYGLEEDTGNLVCGIGLDLNGSDGADLVFPLGSWASGLCGNR